MTSFEQKLQASRDEARRKIAKVMLRELASVIAQIDAEGEKTWGEKYKEAIQKQHELLASRYPKEIIEEFNKLVADARAEMMTGGVVVNEDRV